MKLALFVPCPKCHKLYKKEEVVDFKQEDNPAIMKCQHIEFSNSSVRRSRLCNTALSEKISASTNRTIIRPNLMYPFAEINQTTATMFCRPGRENLLTLGILPGPKEVSLHKVNHYLAPIVNELETLWAGLTLNRTYECENGKRVRGALILVSCDIPAARKICGHVSALVSCHRCEKKANYENGQHNFAGMDDVGYSARDLNEHWQNALGWRRCNSDAARKRFVKETGVRWSELLHLSYFDPIRFITVDPMHCLFLGIAKWIEHLSDVDRRILNHFVRFLIENHHGRDKITPNLHLSLHLRDCSSDYGPLYAFWCFSFERMNGSLPNSNRKIESELMRRLIQRTIGSLSVTDEFSLDEMHRFWLNSQNIKDSQISGKEGFPEPLVEGLDNDIIIRVKIN
ncbi:hypothetical protein GLOIN_2v1775288 [Rhizophagus irregularis DAOM 181602=DAOM 197198]|nr:hypothetical protein GLOIN_2v1775288 [Rhizophagus irregularis DAOM 181602=DAOM 197198]